MEVIPQTLNTVIYVIDSTRTDVYVDCYVRHKVSLLDRFQPPLSRHGYRVNIH